MQNSSPPAAHTLLSPCSLSLCPHPNVPLSVCPPYSRPNVPHLRVPSVPMAPSALTAQQPIDEHSWEWGFLQRTRRAVSAGRGERRGVGRGRTHSPQHQRGRTCRSRSMECSEVSGRLESAEWSFPRSPKGTTPAESKGMGAGPCPALSPHCPVPGNAPLSGGVPVPRGKGSRLSEV